MSLRPFSGVTMRSIVLNRRHDSAITLTGTSFTLELKKKGRSYVRDAAGRLDQTSGDGDT